MKPHTSASLMLSVIDDMLGTGFYKHGCGRRCWGKLASMQVLCDDALCQGLSVNP